MGDSIDEMTGKPTQKSGGFTLPPGSIEKDAGCIDENPDKPVLSSPQPTPKTFTPALYFLPFFRLTGLFSGKAKER
ncbi:MAG: hypothetical protein J7527_16560 [Chitinophagaceae bacterium]|nr:hypothetical protein [Chitinophagaceae bacterium]